MCLFVINLDTTVEVVLKDGTLKSATAPKRFYRTLQKKVPSNPQKVLSSSPLGPKKGGLWNLVHSCTRARDPLSHYTCRATRVAAKISSESWGFFRCSNSIALPYRPSSDTFHIAILAAIVSQNSFVLVFVGVSHSYRAICCKMGYRTDVPV